jgi:hypothetical protein
MLERLSIMKVLKGHGRKILSKYGGKSIFFRFLRIYLFGVGLENPC